MKKRWRLLSSFFLLANGRARRKGRSVDIQKTCFTVTVVVVFFRSSFFSFSLYYPQSIDIMSTIGFLMCYVLFLSLSLSSLVYRKSTHKERKGWEYFQSNYACTEEDIRSARAHKYRDEDVLFSVLFSSAFNVYYIYSSNMTKEKQNILVYNQRNSMLLLLLLFLCIIFTVWDKN
jgi:hypothetical protein